MITYDLLKQVNTKLKTIDIEKKDKTGKVTVKKYTMVNDRVNGFRELFPEGSITTEITYFAEGLVIVKATATDEQGTVLATGHAAEKEGSSFINQSSFIENCETSAVGRCLGFLGIGADDSMASAEEVAAAITQQNVDHREASEIERATFEELCAIKGVKPQDVLRKCGWKSGRMTAEHYGKALVILRDMDNGQ